MDEAWRLEQALWDAITSGGADTFYARHMTSDGYVVVPGAVIRRNDLISRWQQRQPLERHELSDPEFLLVDGESVLITYHVAAHGEWLPNYRARVTALYTWSGGEWALAFRQHTPDGETSFPF